VSAPLPLVLIRSTELRDLLEYSHSLPTGTTIGKRWRRRVVGGWVLGTYVPHPNPDLVGIRWEQAVVIPDDADVRQEGDVWAGTRRSRPGWRVTARDVLDVVADLRTWVTA
jgi:hypothetical protein